jgi:SRSO17 transposase
MAETVADSRYQPLHHMLSESNWDRRGVRRQLVVDANTHFGYPSALLLDESAFGKEGEPVRGRGAAVERAPGEGR